MFRILLFLIIFISVVLSGCSSRASPPDQPITIQSYPKGAQVFVDGERVGTTPTTVTLSPRQEYEILLFKEGCVPQCITLKRSLMHRPLLYLIPFGSVFFVFDLLKNNLFTLTPSRIQTVFEHHYEGNFSLASHFSNSSKKKVHSSEIF